MQVTAPTDALQAGLKACAAAINGRPLQPLLAGVLLTADGCLHMRAFDYETDVRAEINARVDQPGAALVSHRLLTQILGMAGTATVDLITDDNPSDRRLNVTAGRASWRLPMMHDDMYPDPPAIPDAALTVDGEQFRVAVETTALAASETIASGDSNLPFHVALLDVHDTTLTLVATDKYRLHATEVAAEPSGEMRETTLVPAARLAAIVKGFPADRYTLGANEHRLMIAADGMSVTTSLAAWSKPWAKWEEFLGALGPDSAIVYTFDRDDLATAIRQAALVAQSLPSGSKHIVLTVQPGECVLTGGSGLDGDSAITVDTTYEGGAFHVQVDAHYLLDAVTAAAGDEPTVQLSQAKPKGPIGVAPVKHAATHLVVPIVAKSGWANES